MNTIKFVLSTVMIAASMSANATTINELVGKYSLTNQQIISGQNNVGPNAGCAHNIEVSYNSQNTLAGVVESIQGYSLNYLGYLNGQVHTYKTSSNFTKYTYKTTAQMTDSALVINQVKSVTLELPETTIMTVKKVNSRTTTVNYKVQNSIMGISKTKYELLCTYTK